MSTVYLNPGHGDDDPGACGFGRREADDVLGVVLAVGPILKRNGIEVVYTRTTNGGADAHMVNYVPKANREGCDMFVSFHRNASGAGASGYETCVYSNSGKAKSFADQMNSGMKALGYRDRGTKIRTDLYVLNSTDMPAVLMELGFIDNQDDNELFISRYDEMVSLIACSIMAALGMNSGDSSVQKQSTPPANEHSNQDKPEGSNGMGRSGPSPNKLYSYDYDSSVKVLQNILNTGTGAGLKEDGISGPVTYNAVQRFSVEPNDTGRLIKWVQQRLNILGYDAGIEDGIAGPITMAAIERFQKHYGLGRGYLGGTDWYYMIES